MVGGVLVNSIKIKSGGGDYNIEFLNSLKDVTKKINHENNFFIIDKYVHDNFKLVNKKYEKNIVSVLKPNEKIKTLETVEKVASKLVRKGANKHSNIIGIGGGFVQDISQFTSHIYHRGSNLTLIPTTLLSMADSCMGGKCGINVSNFKNQVGVFKSPKNIYIYKGFTKTLSNQLLIDGYGEILKLLITKNKSQTINFLDYLDSNKFEIDVVNKFIRLSLLSKKPVVEIDEYELDYRRILNYGHTFAHAIESLSKNKLGHGHAVGFGLNLANFISYRMGYLDKKVFYKIYDSSYQTFEFEKITKNFKFSKNEYLKTFRTDKKTEGNFTNFILCAGYGELFIKKIELNDKLATFINEFYELNV